MNDEAASGWWLIEVDARAPLADLVEAQLLEAGSASVVVEGAPGENDILEPAPESTPYWPQLSIKGYFSAQHDPALVLAHLHATLPHGAAITAQAAVDDGWLQQAAQQARPLCIADRFWLCPDGFEPPPSGPWLRLTPGLAFGSGEHPTTHLCLRWLVEHPPVGQQVADYGCGSGILGLAALRLGATHVVAVDHDPQALWASRRNAATNQLDAAMMICAPEELDEPWTRPGTDLLLANILLEPLLALAGRFAAMVRPGGLIVLSGILESQCEDLLAGFVPWFEAPQLLSQEGWACLVMRRRPATEHSPAGDRPASLP